VGQVKFLVMDEADQMLEIGFKVRFDQETVGTSRNFGTSVVSHLKFEQSFGFRA
jgi:hypothetical protein